MLGESRYCDGTIYSVKAVHQVHLLIQIKVGKWGGGTAGGWGVFGGKEILITVI